MNIFEKLTAAERARQLANPEGEVGLAVAEWTTATIARPTPTWSDC